MRTRCIAMVLAGAAMLGGCGGGSEPAGPGVTDVRPGDDLFGALGRLEAGDRVVVHAGTYRTAGRLDLRWSGTADKPIVVTGAPGEARPRILGSRDQNVIDLSGTHFKLARVELRGGSHGIRMGEVSDAELDRLVVTDAGDVGISCNRPGGSCRRVAIRRSRVSATGAVAGGFGEGLYLGCQDASCSFSDGRVERNVVHDTGGSQGDGIELKPGSGGNVVRGNVVCRTRGPGLNIWGSGRGSALNLVARNLVAGAGGPGILVHGRARLRANRVLRSARQPGARACGTATRRPMP